MIAPATKEADAGGQTLHDSADIPIRHIHLLRNDHEKRGREGDDHVRPHASGFALLLAFVAQNATQNGGPNRAAYDLSNAPPIQRMYQVVGYAFQKSCIQDAMFAIS
ncbi:MAG: hypothetical protein U0744_18960 [Gemmataceae bacterium]